MPDWITHLAVAWTLCMILGFKYKQFNQGNTVIVLVGSLIPDLYKIIIPLNYLNIHIANVIAPIHLPVGSFIIAGMFSLLFKDRRMIFLFLALGVITHYCLDLLLENASHGIYLFYPFYWGAWQLGLVAVDSYRITILAVITALIVYFISGHVNKVKIKS